jgi:predicted DNA-binding transcriptional regulator AlpA
VVLCLSDHVAASSREGRMNKAPSNKSTLLTAHVGAENVGGRNWPSRKLRVPEAADFCGCSTSKLNKHRVTGDGPAFIKFGRLILYDILDLESWLAQCKRRSTSERFSDFVDDQSRAVEREEFPRAPA